MNKPRKVHVKSFGCQMNVYDSNRMADSLAGAGFSETAQAADADLVILNTCNIREKAVDKLYSEIGRMRELKEEAAAQGRQVLIAVAGCVAQAEGQEITRRSGAVDAVVSYGEPVAADGTADRKAMTRSLEGAVRKITSDTLRGRPRPLHAGS